MSVEPEARALAASLVRDLRAALRPRVIVLRIGILAWLVALGFLVLDLALAHWWTALLVRVPLFAMVSFMVWEVRLTVQLYRRLIWLYQRVQAQDERSREYVVLANKIVQAVNKNGWTTAARKTYTE
jgi:hypothetical protein